VELFSANAKQSINIYQEVLMHPLVQLAIQAFEHFIETAKSIPCPNPLPEDLKQNAGVFVTIKTQDSLRACVGTMTPKYKNLAQEVIRNAIRSANEDPRFDPLEERELPALIFSVDVLKPLKKINNLEEQNVKHFGLAVRGEGKKVVLLPDFDNIKNRQPTTQSLLKKRWLQK
jgi:AmmeMemoRadiSam system protein A